MENFDQIFTLLAEQKGIGLNFDIFESGVINIAILIAILVVVGKDFLGSQLEERQEIIIRGVQDAEEKFNEASARLAEAQKQLMQSQVIIGEIKKDTLSTKRTLLKSDALQASQDLGVRFGRALATLNYREQQVFSEIKEQLITLALKNVLNNIKDDLNPKKQSELISTSIDKLGGQL